MTSSGASFPVQSGESTNIDITLGRVLQMFSAGGVAIDSETALPVPNVRFTVQRLVGENVEYLNVVSGSNTRGEFVIEGLIPGRYRVYMFPNQANELRAEQLSFDIVDQDITGLTLRLAKGASITGVVVLETEDKTALAKLAELQLRAFSTASGATVSSSGTSRIARDGSFHMGGLGPGTHNLMLAAGFSAFPPKGFSIMRIEREGIALRNLEIKDGEQVAGVRVIMAYGTATIKGIVKLENGSLPEGSRIYVRMTKPGEAFSMMRPIIVDARGQFLVEGVAPGTYELQAMIAGLTPSAPRNSKREVTVQNSETTEVIMTIDLTPPAKP